MDFSPNTDGKLCKYRVEVYPTTLSYWINEPLMLTLTAFDGHDTEVCWWNLELILERMFPKLFQFDVKWVRPVVNFPAE